VFEEVEDVAAGLGPVFNADSCAACHSLGATGGGGDQVETRFGTMTAGAFDPMTSHGGSLIQTTGIGAQGACTFTGEVTPDGATIRAGRRTTPLFGLGLVDAVPDFLFRGLAAYQARRQPATAGHINVVTDVVTGRQAVGKFGWKSQVPNLLQFSADAYLNEMGITSPLFPTENCPQGDCALLACPWRIRRTTARTWSSSTISCGSSRHRTAHASAGRSLPAATCSTGSDARAVTSGRSSPARAR